MKLVNWARKNGCFVLTYLGRKRRVPDLESSDRYLSSRAERQIFNAQIQGGVADCMTLCMIRADRDPWLKSHGIVMVGQVHDEVHFIVPNRCRASFAEIEKRLKDIFEHPFKRPLKVPLKFSTNGKFCLTWADCK
jgi:DNA polymerase-1